jgi:RNA polymerase sigma-70 factor, ECF subfamily
MTQEWPDMDTLRPVSEDERESATSTLGALLYSDKTKARVTEHEWVAIVRSIAAGDQLALHALYERTHKIVFTLAMRITNNRETAEEVTLDVFHDVWRRATTYDSAGGPVIGWIMNQARSRAIDRLRFEQRKKRVNPHATDSSMIAHAGPDEAFDHAKKSRRLRDALSGLTDEEREVIETAYFSELSYSQVAAQLNQPLGTVKTRVRSGLGKLRQALAEEVKEP